MPDVVHVVDDDESLRTSLIRLLRSDGLNAIGHSCATDLLTALRPGEPSCILLDVRLGTENGLAIQDALREQGSTVPIIFLTGHGTIPMTVRAIRAGAFEFLAKPVDDTVLLATIRRALASNLEVGRRLGPASGLGNDPASLTNRELRAVECAVAGMSIRQTAQDLGVTALTAKTCRDKAMRKLGAHTLAELIQAAERLRRPLNA